MSAVMGCWLSLSHSVSPIPVKCCHKNVLECHCAPPCLIRVQMHVLRQIKIVMAHSESGMKRERLEGHVPTLPVSQDTLPHNYVFCFYTLFI